jgi:diguanylate cyclase (GGDEF)-like protein
MTMDPNHPLPVKKQPSEMSWATIDRLDWQLWVLALSLILVLGGGVLSFMFPTVFGAGKITLLNAPERAFYGLCVLLGLTLAYLLQKQARLRKIKRELMRERKGWEEELIHNAFYDALTDLPNRALLLNRLHLSLSRAKRHQSYQFAVIYIDLDRFKLVNDSMGHRIGDKVLIEIARRLQQCLRTEDTVARLGGDEFAILLEDVKQINDVSHAIDRIRKELSSPLSLEGRDVFTSASMGITYSSKGYEQAEDLIRDSDTAMYRAKAQGTGQHEVFDASMHEYAVKLLNLETDLRRALDRQELVLHYQPIVLLHTGQVLGLEALVRWRHPVRGLLPPSEFLPVAEAAGMMNPITRYLLQEVCRQTQIWQTECPSSWPLSVSMNLPAKYLTKEDEVQEIITIISELGRPPQSIRLEITENQLMENADTIRQTLLNLTNFGTRIYIDDFGTGFSSLSYLSTFQVDALKIDQSFVRNLNGNDKNSAIVRSIISLGHNLGLDVIAEGIETAEQLSYLLTVKCQYGQGFYFARPMEPERVSQSLAEWFPVSREKRTLAPRLGAFRIFAELDHEQLLEIAQTCEQVDIPSGTVLIHEGQMGDFAYLMEEGTVGVYKGISEKPEFLAVLHAPAAFGEMALLNPEGTRTASVKALSNLRLLTLPIIPCLSFLRRFPSLKGNLVQLATDRSSNPPILSGYSSFI